MTPQKERVTTSIRCWGNLCLPANTGVETIIINCKWVNIVFRSHHGRKGVARALIGVGGHIYIFVRVLPVGFLLKCVVFEFISQERPRSEHEYMNKNGVHLRQDTPNYSSIYNLKYRPNVKHTWYRTMILLYRRLNLNKILRPTRQALKWKMWRVSANTSCIIFLF
jgi:hypothetical protein